MKQAKLGILFCLLVLVACGQQTPQPEVPVSGQAASGLFFSEYIEGSSNNKALEIYNGTSAPIDLAAGGYAVQMYFNGSPSAGLTVNLTGTVPDGDVFVLAQSTANPAILAQADQTSGAGWFNGDDAIVLRQGGTTGTVVDSIGQVGVDPGTEYGTGLASTADNTLRRQVDVCAGDASPNDAFDPATEWNGFATDTFDGLGAHSADCGGTTEPSTPKLVINELDYDQASTDAAEFLEIKNSGSAAVDLDPYQVQLINGGNNTAYQTIDLPATSLAAGDYFVICANTGTTPNCDLDVSPDTNLIQNGSPDAAAIVLDGEVVDTVSYAGDVPGYTEGSGALADTVGINLGLSRLPDGADTDDNSNDFNLSCITPGETNTDTNTTCPTPGDGGGEDGGEIGQCTEPATLIHDVQGSGSASPLDGQAVVVEGVVVGDFQENDGDTFGTDLDGFYLQEEVGDYDTNLETSEGIFVFAPGATNVNVGDLVRVQGTVDEYFGLTQLTDITGFASCGAADVPVPTEVTLPVPSLEAFERYEGMLVTFMQDLVISEYFNFDRFGEIVLAEPPAGLERPYTPTSYVEPDMAAAVMDLNARSRITLDDGRSVQNPDPAYHPDGQVFDQDNLFRGGDRVQNTTGVLDYRFDLYRVQPTTGAFHTPVNSRPVAPEDVGGSLRVASFNVLNLFNGDGLGGGFPTSRGADDTNEYQRQLTKIVAALEAIDADIFGVIEIENDLAGENSSIDDLVDALNGEVGADTYTYIETGKIGTDEIKVGLLYKPATVTPVGEYAVLDMSDDPRFIDTRNRPVLVQTFDENATGGRFTIAVNHLKSKGSACGAGDDDAQQGNCNGTRTQAAEALVDYLATDPTGSGDEDFLIVGDLNSYDEEFPIDEIKAGADDTLGTPDDYTDLIELFQGEFAYSYVFDGQFGYLDYALANQALLPQVTGATEYNINADEPDLLDYDTTFKADAQDALYEPNQYRSSDHDPVVVGLDLTPEVIDLATAIQDLKEDVQALVEISSLNQGQGRALTNRLDQALRFLEQGRADQAAKHLEDFARQVETYVRTGRLTQETGQALIDQAERVIETLR